MISSLINNDTVPKVMTSREWSPILGHLDCLQLAVEKARQVAAATRDQDSTDAVQSDSDNEPNTDTESMSSMGDSLADIVEDMKTFTECLVDLQSTLEFLAYDGDSEAPHTPPNGEFQGVFVFQEASQAFSMMIRERYPSAKPQFVSRLGEANLLRQGRIISRQESMPRYNQSVSQFQGGQSQKKPSDGGPDKLTPLNNNPISESSSSSSQSSIPSSIFSGAPTVDSSKVKGKRADKHNPSPGSDTSFESSLIGGLRDEERRHVPPLPEECRNGQPFQCKICGELQQNIQSRTEWKLVILFVLI
jgi:hypothetical protein